MTISDDGGTCALVRLYERLFLGICLVVPLTFGPLNQSFFPKFSELCPIRPRHEAHRLQWEPAHTRDKVRRELNDLSRIEMEDREDPMVPILRSATQKVYPRRNEWRMQRKTVDVLSVASLPHSYGPLKQPGLVSVAKRTVSGAPRIH